MKLTALTVATTLGLAALMGTNANAAMAPMAPMMTGSLASMTCSAFTHYSAKHRAALLHASMTSKGLATTTSTPRISGRPMSGHDSQTVAGTPLTVGLVISACDAAAPNATVGAALHAANSGGGSSPNPGHQHR